MMEHDALDAGLGDADDDDFDEAVEAADDQLPDHRYLDREISWLSFNQRVLELAEDPMVPVLERANFLAIFASNLDEFFMVRVAGLKRRIAAGVAVRAAPLLMTDPPTTAEMVRAALELGGVDTASLPVAPVPDPAAA